MTSGSTNGSVDSQLTLLASDGTTAIENDDDDGSLANDLVEHRRCCDPDGGHVLPGGQTRCRHGGAPALRSAARRPVGRAGRGGRAEQRARQRDALGRRVRRGSQRPIGRSRHVRDRAGCRRHRVPLARPRPRARRHHVQRPARFRHRRPYPPGSTMRVPEDPDSEAYVATAATAGTYYAFVDSVGAGAPAATYHLSATVIPAVERSCRTYTITPSTGTIPEQGRRDLPDRRARRRARSTTSRSRSTSPIRSWPTSMPRCRRRPATRSRCSRTSAAPPSAAPTPGC